MTAVSVLMPVYNADRFVKQAIRSILCQTFSDFELLILDDGSTDGSLEIVRSFAAQDDRIKYWSRANRGLVISLNEMLDGAIGTFIARMDADDISEPRRLELQIQAFRSTPHLLAVGSDIVFIDSAERRLMKVVMPRGHEEIDTWTMAVSRGTGMSHPTMMLRAEAFKLAGPYRSEFWPAEDADLVLRVAEKGQLANLPLALLRYRVHEDSIGHTQSVQQRDAHYRAAVAAALRRGSPPPDEKLRVLPRETINSIETAAARDTKWAWWALNDGNVRTARLLALRAVLKGPLERATWLVLACALRGR